MAVSALVAAGDTVEQFANFKPERWTFTCLNTDVQVVITTKKGKILDAMPSMQMTSRTINAAGNQITINFVAGPTFGVVWLLIK